MFPVEFLRRQYIELGRWRASQQPQRYRTRTHLSSQEPTISTAKESVREVLQSGAAKTGSMASIRQLSAIVTRESRHVIPKSHLRFSALALGVRQPRGMFAVKSSPGFRDRQRELLAPEWTDEGRAGSHFSGIVRLETIDRTGTWNGE